MARSASSIVNPLELCRVIWHRRLVLLLGLVVSGMAAYVFAATMPSRYISEGMLLIDGRDISVPDLNVWTMGANPPNASNPETFAEILRSQATAAALVRRLDLTRHAEFNPALRPPPAWRTWVESLIEQLPEEWRPPLLKAPMPSSDAQAVTAAVEVVMRNLKVRASGTTQNLVISYESGIRDIPAAVVNALMDLHIAREVEFKDGITRQANAWFAERSSHLLEDIHEADKKIERFRRENGLLEIQAGELSTLNLGALEMRLAEAQSEAARATASYQTALASLEQGTSASEMLGSVVIQRLREQEAVASRKIADLDRRVGERHPDQVAAAAELSDLRRQIVWESNRVVASLGRDAELGRRKVGELESRVEGMRSLAARAASAEVELEQIEKEADAKRQVYATFMARTEQTMNPMSHPPTARIVSPATDPERPFSPRPMLMAVFGSFGGLLLGVAASVARHMIAGGISTPGELASMTGIANLGVIPRVPTRNLSTPRAIRWMLHGQQSDSIETIRGLRIALVHATGRVAQSVLITSSRPGDGKTTCAVLLGRTAAFDGMRVLLVEADLRRPRLRSLLGGAPGRTVEDVVQGRTVFEDAIQVDGMSGLHCLFAAGSSNNPEPLLESQGFRRMMAAARRAYDMIIIDSPPVLNVVDPLVLSAHADVVLFAVSHRHTPRRAVADAVERFPPDTGRVLATVLTNVPRGSAFGGYYAGYRKGPRENTAAVLPV